MKFHLYQYFKETPKLIHVASDAFLGAAGVYTVFGAQPSHFVIASAVVLKILSQMFGKK